MTQTTINRYQPGGDIYAQLKSLYGTAGADQIAQAALSGDETQVNAALVQVKYGQPLNTSTWSLFGQQLATNPLGAPLSGLNSQIGAAVKDVFGNPWIWGTGLVLLFVYMGGLTLLKGKFK